MGCAFFIWVKPGITVSIFFEAFFNIDFIKTFNIFFISTDAFLTHILKSVTTWSFLDLAVCK